MGCAADGNGDYSNKFDALTERVATLNRPILFVGTMLWVMIRPRVGSSMFRVLEHLSLLLGSNLCHLLDLGLFHCELHTEAFASANKQHCAQQWTDPMRRIARHKYV